MLKRKLEGEVAAFLPEYCADSLQIVPNIDKKNPERKIGILDGKTKIEFADGFKMTTEELLNIQ